MRYQYTIYSYRLWLWAESVSQSTTFLPSIGTGEENSILC